MSCDTSSHEANRFAREALLPASKSSGGYRSVPDESTIPGATAFTWCCVKTYTLWSLLDVVDRPLDGKCLGQVLHCSASTPSMNHSGEPTANVRSHVDDFPTRIGNEVSVRHFLREEKESSQIVSQHSVPAFERNILGLGRELPSSIVN
eukprot:CAMPEP_0175998394 /NCGR_PEP_ID=MMETSP0108-20121206/56711_1 /TAXON_ID=195067 ORGANISM="Goniomonas pacifica, Strain CCMP1869" /NCGR_SAMPLE_ID=MMETSP0108 /ASSEMBLY_ACC=CAM_ASM_000204 /LENGTH=148 /DNA_ID=CAMNT_0017330719 /DNA_START=196 /DNA_END=642 /DNA_ORIENTATION=+